jgi:hypothetical protein
VQHDLQKHTSPWRRARGALCDVPTPTRRQHTAGDPAARRRVHASSTRSRPLFWLRLKLVAHSAPRPLQTALSEARQDIQTAASPAYPLSRLARYQRAPCAQHRPLPAPRSRGSALCRCGSGTAATAGRLTAERTPSVAGEQGPALRLRDSRAPSVPTMQHALLSCQSLTHDQMGHFETTELSASAAVGRQLRRRCSGCSSHSDAELV